MLKRFTKEGSTTQTSGFSSKLQEKNERILNRDGSFNIKRRRILFGKGFNLYDTLISLSNFHFFLFLIGAYIGINIVFTLLYFIFGLEGIDGLETETLGDKLYSTFFFSTQTFSTVGYGVTSPTTLSINLIASFEAFIGLLSFAIATGLLYGRFARPKPRLEFSKKAIIAPFRDGKALMFRFANLRNSEMTEVEVDVMMAALGEEKKEFARLELQFSKITFFSTSWTIVHPIDEDSPLFGIEEEDIAKHQLELLILIKGFDDNFAQTIASRMSYNYTDMEYGKKFIPIMTEDKNGKAFADLAMLNDTEDITF